MDKKTVFVLSLLIVSGLILGLTWSLMPPVDTSASGTIYIEGVDIEIPRRDSINLSTVNADNSIKIRIEKLSIEASETNIDVMLSRLMLASKMGGISLQLGEGIDLQPRQSSNMPFLMLVGIIATILSLSVAVVLLLDIALGRKQKGGQLER